VSKENALDRIFPALKQFVYPRFREEGPPRFIQGMLEGEEFLGEPLAKNPKIRSVIEMVVLGYRPVTSFAILSVLVQSPKIGLHGMQIGRELEKRFGVPAGWFTHNRYYSDRVGRPLLLLTKLGMIQESAAKDARGRRSFTAYQINPEMEDAIRGRLQALAEDRQISIFPVERQIAKMSVARTKGLKVCSECLLTTHSATAKFCEQCGLGLNWKCPSCKALVELKYQFCLDCGDPVS
jgi:hypothetical protein